MTNIEAAMDTSLQHLQRQSEYRGVTLSGGKWTAQIRVDGKQLYVGSFEDRDDAARAYDLRAIELGRPSNFGDGSRETFSVNHKQTVAR